MLRAALLLIAFFAQVAVGEELWFICLQFQFLLGYFPFDPATCMTEILTVFGGSGGTPGMVTTCIGDDSQGLVSGTDPGLPYARGRYNTSCGVERGGLWFEPALLNDIGFFRRLSAPDPQADNRDLQAAQPQPTCWGDVAQGQGAWPSGAGYLETYVVGGSFVCGVYTNGLDASLANLTRELRCWGSGPGAVVPEGLTVPARLSPLLEHASSDLATGTRRRRRRSPPSEPLIGQVMLVAGQSHACVAVNQPEINHRRRRQSFNRRRGAFLRDDSPGYLACWGDNSWQQADPCQWREPGDSNASVGCFGVNDSVREQAAAGWFPYRVQAMVLGLRHTCVLVQNFLHCWGDDSYGQLNSIYRDNNFLSGALVAGDYHTCGNLGNLYDYRRLEESSGEDVRRLGGLSTQFVCWGRNNAGQTDVPVDLTGLVVNAAAGAEHTCAYALDFNGQSNGLRCWGSNSHGQTDVLGAFAFLFKVEAFDRATCYTGFPTTTMTTSTKTSSTVTTVTSTTTETATTSTRTTSTATTSTATTSTGTTSTVTTLTSTTSTRTSTTTVTKTGTETSTSTATVTGTSTSTATRTATVTSTGTATATPTSTGTETTIMQTATESSTTTEKATETRTMTATATSTLSTGTSNTTRAVTMAGASTVTETTTPAAPGTTPAASGTTPAASGTTPSAPGTSPAAPETTPTLVATSNDQKSLAPNARLPAATTISASETLQPGTISAAPDASSTTLPIMTSSTVAATTAKAVAVQLTTTRSGVQLKVSFTGLDCTLLTGDVAIQTGFIAAVEQGILASIGDARITRQHVVTRISCRDNVRRLQMRGRQLQSGGGILDTESVIEAQAAQLSAHEVQTSLDAATVSGSTRTNLETRVRDAHRIADVTRTGQLPSVFEIVQSAIVEVMTTTAAANGPLEQESPTSAGSRCVFAACVLAAAALGVLAP